MIRRPDFATALRTPHTPFVRAAPLRYTGASALASPPLMTDRPTFIHNGSSLSRFTTLEVGGGFAALASPMNDREVAEALAWAREREQAVLVLGGGSNLLAADADTNTIVLQSADFTIDVEVGADDRVRLHVGAGVEWDELVAFSVDEGLAGLECLSGIPGRVGAAPIQNIGAYGQEVGPVIRRVRRVARADGTASEVDGDACGFDYRMSHFKGAWRDAYVVTGVTLELVRGGPPTLAYTELQQRLGVRERGPAPSLAAVRRAVLEIRADKAMVLDPADANTRSAGSFFMNPIVDAATLATVRERVTQAGLDPAAMPAYPAANGDTKLSAAWLIERAGFARGFAFGRAGLSERHCLAIINRDGATARDIVQLASLIRRGVRRTFGVTLCPEPVFVGFDEDVDALLR